ncbi:hypothetical protein METP3_00133 [Methanosarcinales archaeon]|nr:hypothetical protein METP3_00133 [Methanosarcinales archaeon]
MSVRKIADDESGITYTLEAIIGVLLIIGTIIYLTGNMPYTAQKTGEHSKVQLMNIGRDNIDLTLITPAYEIGGEGKPYEKYILRADRYANILPGETINFTVYDVYSGELINKSFNFNGTTLIISNPFNITSYINETTVTQDGNHSWRNVASGIVPNGNYTYSIQAYDSNPTVGYSNFTTIKIGYYNLEGTTSISGDGNISGAVTDANGSGVPNLEIQIWEIKNGGLNLKEPNANTTDANGEFTFLWSTNCKTCNTGTYFIQARNTTTGNLSNMQVIEYSGGPGSSLCASFWTHSSCDNITVYAQQKVDLYMGDGGTFPSTNFWVNYIKDAGTNLAPLSGTYITTDSTNKNAKFRANIPGIYSVYVCSNGCNNIWTSAQKTNIILIYVIPIDPGPIEDTCVNGTELNKYMRRYIPLNIDYNLYLIGPSGDKFTKCPDFRTGEVINGYPTAEAVTVNKLVHIKYIPTEIDNIVEYRMVLWYK